MSYSNPLEWKVSSYSVSFDVTENGHPSPIVKVTLGCCRDALDAQGNVKTIPETGANARRTYHYREYDFTLADCVAFCAAADGDPEAFRMAPVAGGNAFKLWNSAFMAPVDSLVRFMVGSGRWKI